MAKWPVHQNPRREREAKAPYNFVPLPEQVVTVTEVPFQDEYSGYSGTIDCQITTESPIYTRCATSPGFFAEWGESAFHQLPEDKKDEMAKFFAAPGSDRPVIPGSSLRGMIRTLVEIAGYGKVQWVSDDQLVFRSLPERYYRLRLLREDRSKHSTPLMQAGYLEQEGTSWYIRPAMTISGTTFARIHHDEIPEELSPWHGCKNAYKLWVRLGRYDYQDVRGGFIKVKYTPVLEARASETAGFREAVLAYSGPMDKKEREAVFFPPNPDADRLEIPEKLVRIYRQQVSQEQETLLGENGALNPHQPVFYLIENGELIFFGHVMLFRLPYPHTPWKLVPERLRSNSEIDLAEAIFGFVPQDANDERQARAGRAFFEDAHPDPHEVDFWLPEEQITPKVLSSPKPTTFQHYLVQQEPNNPERLNQYASPPHKTVIRGHKLYWHKPGLTLDDIRETDQGKIAKHPKQYTRIMPVKAGVNFQFQIRFENLHEYELGALLWALTLPGENGKEYRHKLGMGKPLGMGSIRISPTLCLSDRTSDKGNRYRCLFDQETKSWHLAEQHDADASRFIEAFEQYVLDHMDQDERAEAQRLVEVTRIQMLLKMLERPGPPKGQTRYLEIEHAQHGNEYKGRPVLPDPLVVAGEPVRPPTPPRAPRSRPLPPADVSPQTTQPARPKAEQPTSPPMQAKKEYQTGTVTYFNLTEGRGIILLDSTGAEVEIGIEQLRQGTRFLSKDSRVSFRVVEDGSGIHLTDAGPE